MIRFSRTNAPLLITDEDCETLGSIRPCYRKVMLDHCPTCQQPRGSEDRIVGYRLEVNGRYWGREGLRAKGQGGATGRRFRRLKTAKAMAEKVLA